MKTILYIIFAVLVFIPFSAQAVETIKSPIIKEGIFEFEDKGKYQHDSNPKRDDEKEYDLALSYGVTKNWKTRLETEFEQKRTGDFHYKNTNWENTLGLTGNESFLSTALYLDVLMADRSDSSHSITTGMIGQKDLGTNVHTANLFFKREFGDTASNKTSLVYRWQSRYRLYSFLEPGFELWGDTNKRDAFRDQSLKIGPGLFGKFDIGSIQNIGYELVYLVGATPASHNGTLKWKLSYAFQ